MHGAVKWQSLALLFRDMSDLSFKLEDLILSASQLALALELDMAFTRTGTSSSLERDTSLNQNEELE